MNLLRNLIYRVLEQANADGAAGAGGAGAGPGAGGEADGGDGGGADTAQRTEVETRAREMGWAPKDQWRGNPSGWLDAPDFVQRGEQILPILQANYRKTEAELRQLKQQNQRLQQQFQAANESIEVLTNLSTEATRQSAKEKRRELLRQQSQARTDGNADAEIELGEQIADLTAEINRAEDDGQQQQRGAKGKKTGTGQNGAGAGGDQGQGGDQGGDQGANDPTKDPAYQSFVQQNSWFGTDRRRTALAVAIGQELRADPANNQLQGKAFFDKVLAEVNRTIAPPRMGSKVEGGANGGAGNGGAGSSFTDPTSGKTFNDLPLEAKAAFERQSKLVVGEGRAFKDKEAWRKYYLQSYFNS